MESQSGLSIDMLVFITKQFLGIKKERLKTYHYIHLLMKSLFIKKQRCIYQ